LAVAASLGLSAPASSGAQAPHTGAQPPTETKIGASAHIESLRPGYELPHGQTLHYEGEWRFLPAGVATLRIERAGPQEHVTATADSIGVVALLYRVQDQFNSYFDAKSLCSYKLLKHTEPSCVTDVLSGIFYVGSLPLQPGANYRFPLNNGGKTVTVQAHVEGKEQIKTPAGTFQTIRVGPEGDSGILSGRIWIWYTDDARRLPVQMRAKLFWGMLTIYLTSIGK
jgi:hypothetical protein